MPKFRKKPVVIDAIQFTGENCIECLAFMGESNSVLYNPELHTTDSPVIHTLEGTMTTSVGDWIIKGVKGEFYPCKPDIFEASYEEVKDVAIEVRYNLGTDQLDLAERIKRSNDEIGTAIRRSSGRIT